MVYELNLRNLRKSKLFTQRQLADTLGCSAARIAMLENNKITPNLTTMQDLAKVLEVDLQTIIECFVQDEKKSKKE